MSMMLRPPKLEQGPSLLPGSEIVRIRSWQCAACQDRWLIFDDQDQTAVAFLIHHHVLLWHGGEPIEGNYANHLCLIRPPKPDEQK